MNEAVETGRAGEVTRLLHDVRGGEPGAADRLFALVYDELREVAGRQLRGRGDAVHPTELVHELYLKLGPTPSGGAESRAHFLAVAARAMRQILVDLARRRGAAKRGGGWAHTTLSGKDVPAAAPLEEVLALDDALAALDERQRRVVEMRFFAGMTEDEIAAAMGVTTRTVQRDWVKARAWLYRAMYGEGE